MLHVSQKFFDLIAVLRKMGAKISIDVPSMIVVEGVDTLHQHLYGANVVAADIRASTALLVAGLMADGITHVAGLHIIGNGAMKR